MKQQFSVRPDQTVKEDHLPEHFHQAQVFLKVDNSIHWINLYPVDHAVIGFLIIICWIGIYPVDSSTQGLIFADQLFASAFDFGKCY